LGTTVLEGDLGGIDSHKYNADLSPHMLHMVWLLCIVPSLPVNC